MEELNKEYNKYAKEIVSKLSESLKEGEYFIFTKKEKGGYGFILSREREKLSNIHREEGEVSVWDILNILETKPLFL